MLGLLFSKPVNLGTSVRKRNRRSRNKQRPKKWQQKHYCSTSPKVPYEAFGFCLKLAFLKHKGTNLNIFKYKVDGIRTQKAQLKFVHSLILKVSNLAIMSWMTVFLWKCEINFYWNDLLTQNYAISFSIWKQ